MIFIQLSPGDLSVHCVPLYCIPLYFIMSYFIVFWWPHSSLCSSVLYSIVFHCLMMYCLSAQVRISTNVSEHCSKSSGESTSGCYSLLNYVIYLIHDETLFTIELSAILIIYTASRDSDVITAGMQHHHVTENYVLSKYVVQVSYHCLFNTHRGYCSIQCKYPTVVCSIHPGNTVIYCNYCCTMQELWLFVVTNSLCW